MEPHLHLSVLLQITAFENGAILIPLVPILYEIFAGGPAPASFVAAARVTSKSKEGMELNSSKDLVYATWSKFFKMKARQYRFSSCAIYWSACRNKVQTFPM